MSNKNTFDGLQFRIMETLERQPNHAPLMATEIAERLHSTEYSDEMKDNVVFKVTRAVHSMVEKGKIIRADARGPQGQLCYQLPQRLKFPAKPGDKPPVNPVLTADLAQQIKTVEPKHGEHPIYAPGIQEEIVKLLNASAHPMISPEIADALAHLYPENIRRNLARLRMLFAGHLYTLTRGSQRRVFARRINGYGRGVKFEYYSRKTGLEPHPLSLKNHKGSRAAEAKKPAAPKPSEAWREPAPAPTPTPAPAARATGNGVFRPGVKKVETVQMNVEVPRDKRDAWKAAADRFGVPFSQMVIEALDYALEHAETA